MGRNYYDVLGVSKSATDTDIKKAYKKAALKFHPDRPGGDKVKFQEVSEAFEVLSDKKKKQLYDQFGEAGLGAGGGNGDDMPSGGGGSPFAGFGGGGGGGQTFSFRTTQGGMGGGGFHGSDPFSVFESIFGTMDVDQAMNSGEGGFSSFPLHMGGMGMGGMPSGMGMGMSQGRRGGGGRAGAGGGAMPTAAGTRQAPPLEHTLNLSLEELYHGTSKRMRITKKTASGEAQVDKTIAIKPGWKDGTRITFEKEGDEQPGMIPADIIFVIKTKPHERFERVGNNLIYTAEITLDQALTGFVVTLETLDGRKFTVEEPNGITCSAHETTVRGEGMPSQKDRGTKGNLIVRYIVHFPVRRK